MMNYDVLISFVFAVAALAISPGPDNIFVLMQSVVYGKKYGIATVIGLMTGCIVHTTFIAFGVSALITSQPSLFFGIKILGAIYMLYLAFQLYKSSSDVRLDSNSVEKKTTVQLFRIGFFMNVLNPKVTIFFLALFPGFLFSETLSNVIQFYILGGLFILTSFVIFSTIAMLGGIASEKIQRNKSIQSFLKWLQILVFVGIAVFVLI